MSDFNKMTKIVNFDRLYKPQYIDFVVFFPKKHTFYRFDPRIRGMTKNNPAYPKANFSSNSNMLKRISQNMILTSLCSHKDVIFLRFLAFFEYKPYISYNNSL